MLKGGGGLGRRKRSQNSAVHSTIFKKHEHHCVFLERDLDHFPWSLHQPEFPLSLLRQTSS